MKNLMGQKFGRWTILKFVYRKNSHDYWECKCECGNQNIVRDSTLISGESKSCGCLQKELILKRITKHNLYYTNFYGVWSGIKSRCNDINHKYYGGRGITVCKRWLKFENFRNDMHLSYKEHKLNNKYTSIDRINNDKGYSKQNCRWATKIEQQNNIRCNHLLTYNKQILSIAQWAKKLKFADGTIRNRINRGWSIEKALNTPARIFKRTH